MLRQWLGSFSGRAFARALFGAVGGFMAWILVEPFVTDVRHIRELFEGPSASSAAVAWVFVGASFGVAIVGLEEWLWGARQRALRSVLLAAILGVLGGSIAFSLGGALFQQFGSIVLRYPEGSSAQLGWLILARSLTWALVGGTLGLVLGAVRKSWRGALHTAFGGLIGGFLGGILFDTLAPQVGQIITLGLVESGWASRLIGFTLMGALIGLFSSLTEQLLAPALLKIISSGRMEGREFSLDKPIITIGRDERCDIPLYYDRTVALRHAILRWENQGYAVVPEKNATVLVNNLPVHHRLLADGDVLTVGQTRLLFRTKHVAVLAKPERKPALSKPCPSCGALNRASAKFCSQCGAMLPQEGQSASQPLSL